MGEDLGAGGVSVPGAPDGGCPPPCVPTDQESIATLLADLRDRVGSLQGQGEKVRGRR